MEKIYLPIFMTLLLLMSACNIVIVPSEPEFSASDLTIETDYEDEVGDYICNDVTTEMTYRFDYEGRIERWTQELREYDNSGDFSERVTLQRTIRSGNTRATVNEDSVTFNFLIQPGEAVEDAGDSSALLVQQEPVVDTRLRITAFGTDGTSQMLEEPIRTKCVTF